jgi:hypothetical protein
VNSLHTGKLLRLVGFCKGVQGYAPSAWRP